MNIIGVGYETVHDIDFTMIRPHGYGAYLLLVLKTESFHVFHNERTIVPADSIILYDETTPQCYGAIGKQYIDDWIHFSMDEEDLCLLNKLAIPRNIPISMRDTSHISSLIRSISYEFYSATPNHSASSKLYLQILFHKMNEIIHYDRIDTLLPYYSHLVNLRTDIYNTPAYNWKVDDMSKRLNLSTSHFQHIYKKSFGISAINDVISSRISHSKKLLSGTNLPISKIAELCGYEYDIYFMRQFKSRTGITPKEYRKQKEYRK